MGFYPLIPDSLHRQPVPLSSELVIVNAFDHPPVPAIVGSLAGFAYRLPPLGQLRPVVRIRAFDVAQFNYNITTPDGVAQVPSDYTNWYLYTRDPSGTQLMRAAPVQQFVERAIPNSKFGNIRPRWLDAHFIDPLQSYLICTADNLTELVALQFDYL